MSAMQAPAAVPGQLALQVGKAPPAVPKALVPYDTIVRDGVQRLPGGADSWKIQMIRSALDACRLCCPEEPAPMSAVRAQETDTWLNLLCWFSAPYDICFVPSPEEISIIVRSQESWADVVRYDPISVQFHVVSDSTLVWSRKSRGGLLKN